MFKKVGTPVFIDEVVNFDPSIAAPVSCSCGAKLGLRSAGLFQATGSTKIATSGTPVSCASCGETTNV